MNHRERGFLIKSLSSCLFILAMASGLACSETLEQAVYRAVTTHPDTLAAQANLAASRDQLTQARGGYFPSIDMLSSAGRNTTENRQLRAAGIGTRSLDGQETAFTLRQMLFDGFGVSSNVDQQSALVDSAGARLSDTAEDVALRAINAYLNVMRDEELLSLAEHNAYAHLETRDKMQLRVDSGVSPGADLYQAEARLAAARTTVTNRQAILRDSRATYLRVMGEPAFGLSSPTRAVKNLPGMLDQAIEQALQSHPRVRTAQAELSAAQSAIGVAKSSLFPHLDLELSTSRAQDMNGIEGTVYESTAMLVMNYNLFRGGSDLARVSASQQQEIVAKEQLEGTLRAVTEDVSLAWSALVDANESLTYLERQVQSDEKTLEAYQYQFQLGRRTLLDVLNAENELFQARSNRVARNYGVINNEYRLLGSMGVLTDTFGLGAATQYADVPR